MGTAFGPGLMKNTMGAARMKKLSFVLAAAGLMTLAACNKPTATENVAENASEALENIADSLENAADATTNEATEAALENAADNAHAAADNAAEVADNAN
jgi:hypothetical protein